MTKKERKLIEDFFKVNKITYYGGTTEWGYETTPGYGMAITDPKGKLALYLLKELLNLNPV